MKAINWLFKKVIKIRIEGPIDGKIQQRIMNQLSHIKPRNSEALIVIINSYGGSLRVAKNISLSLQSIRAKQVPIYCFAEEYCLNSANLILTSGTQCFANKFSIIGDFGYVYENYNFDNFNKKFNVGFDKISTTKQELTSFGNIYQLNNQQFIQKLVANSATQLKNYLLENRRDGIKQKLITPQSFEQNILKGGSVDPTQAVSLGLIDGLETYDQFLKKNFKGYRIKEDKQYFQYRAINFLRSSLQIFKQQ